jgi:hypothetical protein
LALTLATAGPGLTLPLSGLIGLALAALALGFQEGRSEYDGDERQHQS